MERTDRGEEGSRTRSRGERRWGVDKQARDNPDPKAARVNNGRERRKKRTRRSGEEKKGGQNEKRESKDGWGKKRMKVQGEESRSPVTGGGGVAMQLHEKKGGTQHTRGRKGPGGREVARAWNVITTSQGSKDAPREQVRHSKGGNTVGASRPQPNDRHMRHTRWTTTQPRDPSMSINKQVPRRAWTPREHDSTGIGERRGGGTHPNTKEGRRNENRRKENTKAATKRGERVCSQKTPGNI